MPNVLIRDVSPDDLDEIRAAAAEQGTSLQSYLLDAVHAQAVYVRRQAAIARLDERLKVQPPVSEVDRDAILVAIQDSHDERDAQLGGWSEN